MCISLGILIFRYKKFDALHEDEDPEDDEPVKAVQAAPEPEAAPKA